MTRISCDKGEFETAVQPFRLFYDVGFGVSDDVPIACSGSRLLTIGHVRDLLSVAFTVIEDPAASSVPPKTPGPKPAAEPNPQRAEAATENEAAAALMFLSGFVHAHANNQAVNPVVLDQLTLLARYMNTGKTLDPRVTFSVDYGLADKLGNQLEAINASLGTLRRSITDFQDRRLAIENVDEIKTNLEAAIKTCNELGLPW